MNDLQYILKWFLVFFAIGIAFLPLTFEIFKDFKDKGYIFSKIIGLAFISYLVFLIGSLRIAKFSESTVYFSLFLFFIINYLIFIYKKCHLLSIIKAKIKVFAIEEIIFLILLFFWSAIRSNSPDIHGLEKFMDFGFLNSILRADYFPAKDMWYTPLSINYYYFGHLITAVLTKMSFIPSFISYNLMLATLFALTFTASLSLGINLFDKINFSIKSTLAGLLSAILVSFGGNLTTIYAFFKAYVPADKAVPFWQLPFLPFSFPNGYWYPNATRFIPFTIHEFPLYSFVVSDLHGHVLDIPFVLLSVAIIFAFFNNKKITFLNLLLLSFIFSIMYMTNAWDGLIYLLLGFLALTVFNFYKLGKKWLFSVENFYRLIKNCFTLVIGFFVFALPFNLNFKPFVSGIGVICAPTFLTNLGRLGPFLFEANHCQKSPLWQLIMLYGFFYFFVFSFVAFLKFKRKYKISKTDIFVLILIILSTTLIIIPEFIYVKDIYPTYYRANTMFKLVYEAFIMLSFCSAFIIVKLISSIKNKVILISFFGVTILLLSLVLIYPVFAINGYYGDLKTYKNLDGTAYLSTLYPGDYSLINWINKYIKGQPVILEANGDSYTDYARISANTGLPTIIGWSVHEWLWRGTYDVVAPRIADVQTLYTTQDMNIAKNLLKKYNVSYVVVSSLERQKYPTLNENIFAKLGKIVFEENETKLYKIIR
jgi:YYY domain-containing protein